MTTKLFTTEQVKRWFAVFSAKTEYEADNKIRKIQKKDSKLMIKL